MQPKSGLVGPLGSSWAVLGRPWGLLARQRRPEAQKNIAFRLEEGLPRDHFGTILVVEKQSYRRDETSRNLRGRKLDTANARALSALRGSISCFFRLCDLQPLRGEIFVLNKKLRNSFRWVAFLMFWMRILLAGVAIFFA